MRTKRSGFPAYFLRVLSCAVAMTVSVLDAQGQLTNNWIDSASAPWESASSWSLGILPASNQTVSITNDGYKAVDIDSATFASYPDSLTVSNLAVSAPTNGLSTLLLNNFGIAAPLKVLNQCDIGTNGTLDNLGSSFEVDGSAGAALLLNGGTFTQEGGLTVVDGPVFVLNGSLNATNADLTLGNVTLGSNGLSSGYVNQDGTSIAAQSIDIEQGAYRMQDGVLYGINGTTCTGGPFDQFGGTNYGNITLVGDYYDLHSGMVQGNTLTAVNSMIYEQDSGLTEMQFINVGGTTNYPTDFPCRRLQPLDKPLHRPTTILYAIAPLMESRSLLGKKLQYLEILPPALPTNLRIDSKNEDFWPIQDC